MNPEITIYTPNYRQKIGFFQTWGIMISNIIRSRQLIYQLFKRDFFMTYKKSFLGMAWILISPIIGIASWVFLSYADVLQPGQLSVPFPVYILIGSSIWGLFMGFYGSASGTLGAGAGFIMQVKYPHEVLLVKQVAQHLAGFSITFVVNILVLLAFGVVPSWQILLLPLLTLPMFFLGAGLGLIFSVIGVVATDLNNFMSIILGFVYYITPIVYTQDKIKSPLLQTIVELNPLTYIVGGVRDLILFGQLAAPERFLFVGVLSLVFFMLAWRFFYISEDKVVERMI